MAGGVQPALLGVVRLAAGGVERFAVALVATHRGERPARLRLAGRATAVAVTIGALFIGGGHGAIPTSHPSGFHAS